MFSKNVINVKKKKRFMQQKPIIFKKLLGKFLETATSE